LISWSESRNAICGLLYHVFLFLTGRGVDNVVRGVRRYSANTKKYAVSGVFLETDQTSRVANLALD